MRNKLFIFGTTATLIVALIAIFVTQFWGAYRTDCLNQGGIWHIYQSVCDLRSDNVDADTALEDFSERVLKPVRMSSGDLERVIAFITEHVRQESLPLNTTDPAFESKVLLCKSLLQAALDECDEMFDSFKNQTADGELHPYCRKLSLSEYRDCLQGENYE